MGGDSKNKKKMTKNEEKGSAATPKGKNIEIALGAKMEAMDYLGTWYDARIVKLKPEKKEVLIHFDGWNSRFDVWLPYNSNKLREAKRSKSKGLDWRVGSRIVAKWGPANKIYPAIVSRIVSDKYVEVRFYDGFKKTLKKSSLQPDTEKLYRKYGEGSAIKEILNPATLIPIKTPFGTIVMEEKSASVTKKRRLTEPPGMADYVIGTHKRRSSLRGSDMSPSEDDKSSICGGRLSSPEETTSTTSTSHRKFKPKTESQSLSILGDSKSGMEKENDICVMCTEEKPGSSCIQNQNGASTYSKENPIIFYSQCANRSNTNIGNFHLEGKQSIITLLKSEDADGGSLQSLNTKEKEQKINAQPELSTSSCNISKMKSGISEDPPSMPASETIKHSLPKSSYLTKGSRTQSGVEIIKNKCSSYMMFPILSPEDSDDSSSSPVKISCEPNWPQFSLNTPSIEQKTMMTCSFDGHSTGDRINISVKDSHGMEADVVTKQTSSRERAVKKMDRKNNDPKNNQEMKNESTSHQETLSKGRDKLQDYLLTDLSSKLPENSRETRRRKSNLNKSTTTNDKKLTTQETRMTANLLNSPSKENIITTIGGRRSTRSNSKQNTKEDSDDDKPLIFIQNSKNDSEDNTPLISVKLGKEKRHSKTSKEIINKHNLKSRRYSEGRENIKPIAKDKGSPDQILRNDSKRKDISELHPSDTSGAANTASIGTREAASRSLRQSTRDKGKMQSKDGVGEVSNVTDSPVERMFGGECFKVINVINDDPDSPNKRRHSSRIKSSACSDEKDTDNSETGDVMLDSKCQSTSHSAKSKKSQPGYPDTTTDVSLERTDQSSSRGMCLRNRDSKEVTTEVTKQQSTDVQSKESKKDSKRTPANQSAVDLITRRQEISSPMQEPEVKSRSWSKSVTCQSVSAVGAVISSGKSRRKSSVTDVAEVQDVRMSEQNQLGTRTLRTRGEAKNNHSTAASTKKKDIQIQVSPLSQKSDHKLAKSSVSNETPRQYPKRSIKLYEGQNVAKSDVNQNTLMQRDVRRNSTSQLAVSNVNRNALTNRDFHRNSTSQLLKKESTDVKASADEPQLRKSSRLKEKFPPVDASSVDESQLRKLSRLKEKTSCHEEKSTNDADEMFEKFLETQTKHRRAKRLPSSNACVILPTKSGQEFHKKINHNLFQTNAVPVRKSCKPKIFTENSDAGKLQTHTNRIVVLPLNEDKKCIPVTRVTRSNLEKSEDKGTDNDSFDTLQKALQNRKESNPQKGNTTNIKSPVDSKEEIFSNIEKCAFEANVPSIRRSSRVSSKTDDDADNSDMKMQTSTEKISILSSSEDDSFPFGAKTKRSDVARNAEKVTSGSLKMISEPLENKTESLDQYLSNKGITLYTDIKAGISHKKKQCTTEINELPIRRSSRVKSSPKTCDDSEVKEERHSEDQLSSVNECHKSSQDIQKNRQGSKVQNLVDESGIRLPDKGEILEKANQGLLDISTPPVRRSSRQKSSVNTNRGAEDSEKKTEKGSNKTGILSSRNLVSTPVTRTRKDTLGATKTKQELTKQEDNKDQSITKESDIVERETSPKQTTPDGTLPSRRSSRIKFSATTNVEGNDDLSSQHSRKESVNPPVNSGNKSNDTVKSKDPIQSSVSENRLLDVDPVKLANYTSSQDNNEGGLEKKSECQIAMERGEEISKTHKKFSQIPDIPYSESIQTEQESTVTPVKCHTERSAQVSKTIIHTAEKSHQSLDVSQNMPEKTDNTGTEINEIGDKDSYKLTEEEEKKEEQITEFQDKKQEQFLSVSSPKSVASANGSEKVIISKGTTGVDIYGELLKVSDSDTLIINSHLLSKNSEQHSKLRNSSEDTKVSKESRDSPEIFEKEVDQKSLPNEVASEGTYNDDIDSVQIPADVQPSKDVDAEEYFPESTSNSHTVKDCIAIEPRESNIGEIKRDTVTPATVSPVVSRFEGTPIINIFEQVIPDLNSGRPVRKNKHKKPARYSNELSPDSHSKSLVQVTSKSRRDSREKNPKSPNLEKVEISVQKSKNESKDKKSPTSQESIHNSKSLREMQKDKDETNVKSRHEESSSSKPVKAKDVPEKKMTSLRPRRDSKEKESKASPKEETLSSRRNDTNKIPVKVNKIMKPKISLQTVTVRKHSVLNKKFEEKYEMFKKKWKEEKERRRMLHLQDNNSCIVQKVREKVVKTQKVSEKDNIEKCKEILKTVTKEDVHGSNDSIHSKDIEIVHDVNKTPGTLPERVDTPSESLPVQEKEEPDADVSLPTEVNKEASIEKATPKFKHRIKHTPHSKFGKAYLVKSPLSKRKKKSHHVARNCSGETSSSKEKSEDSTSNTSREVKQVEVSTESNTEIPESDKSNNPAVTSSGCSEGSNKTNQSVPKKGRPKKKRRIDDDADFIPDPEDIHKLIRDTSRTPSDTISFASMIEDERPSQRKRPEVVKPPMKKSPLKHFPLSPQKMFQPRFIVQSFRPFFAYAPRQHSFPTAAQIAASRIQKRVHQQKLMSMLNSPEHHPYRSNLELCNYPPEHAVQLSFDGDEEKAVAKESNVSLDDDSDDNIVVVQPSVESEGEKNRSDGGEIDIMDITLDKTNKEEGASERPQQKCRKSLDFITARLKYKQKVERQRIDSVVGRLKHHQDFDSQTEAQVDPHVRNSPDVQASTCISNPEDINLSYPNAFRPPPGVSNSRSVAPNVVPQMAPIRTIMNPPPMQHDRTMYLNLAMPRRMALPIATVMSPLHAQVLTPPQPQHILSIPGNPSLMHSPEFTNINNYRPMIRCSLDPSMARTCNPFDNTTLGPRIGSSPHPFQNQAVVPHPFQHPHMGDPHHALFPPQQVALEDLATVRGCKENYFTEGKEADKKDSPAVEVSSSPDGSNKESSSSMMDTNTKPSTLENEEIEISDAKVGTPDLSIKMEDGKKKKKQQKVVPEKENLYTFRREKRIRSPKDIGSGSKKAKIEPEKVSQGPTLKDVPIDSALNEYKCNITDCGKTFRKSHLLEYHIKYFHTAKPFQKRSRTSTSVSSTESSPVSAVTAETSPKVGVSPGAVELDVKPRCTEVELTEQSDSTISESESESEDELPTVDDCVKCVCEDECELGFMIQCEQCFTWQHGECVGYSQPKSVPLFYLCHVCSNPKGLRKSSQYDNDYTWFRHGLLPPLRHDTPDDKLDEIDFGRHVDIDNEELLSSIMLTTHAMMTDLYNIRDVLQGVRDKFILIKDPQNPILMKWKEDNDQEILTSISQKMKENEDAKKGIAAKSISNRTECAYKSNNPKKITEKFDEDLHQRLVSINNKNTETKVSANETVPNNIPNENNKNSSSEITETSIANSDIITFSKSCDTKANISEDIDSDVYVVVSSIVQMLCYMVSTNSSRVKSSENKNSMRESEKDKSEVVFKKTVVCNADSIDDSETDDRDIDRLPNNEKSLILTSAQNITIGHSDEQSTKSILKSDVICRESNAYHCGTDVCETDVCNTGEIKDMVENIVSKVCSSINTKLKEVKIDNNSQRYSSDVDRPYVDHMLKYHNSKNENICPTESKEAEVKVPKELQIIKPAVEGERVASIDQSTCVPSGTDINLRGETNNVCDEDFIDIANISEDSIPYMETDEEFYPTKEKLNSSIETESTLTSYENEEGHYRPLTCRGIDNIMKDAGDWNNSSRESLIARYNVLVEIERIEDQINDRLEDMHAKLDELESEYDSIDKSKAILEDFKRNFQVPDLKSLMVQLNKVKWQSIIKSNTEHLSV